MTKKSPNNIPFRKLAIIKLKRTVQNKTRTCSNKTYSFNRVCIVYFLVVIWIVFDGFLTFFFGPSETARLIPPFGRDNFSQKRHLCNYVASLVKPGNCFVIKYSKHSLLAAKSELNLPVKLSFKMYFNPSKSSGWS